jgi:Fe-S-cluster containining protein
MEIDNKIKINAKTPLNEILELGMVCNRNNNCCNHGSGFLVEGDAEKIAKFLRINEEKLKKKYLEEKEQFNKKLWRPKLKAKDMPYGKCIFFKGNGCSIHKVKPLQCRTGSCSKYGEELSVWFLLNYIIDKDDPESIRQYALYIKSGGKVIPGGKLEDIVPDKKKLEKILNYNMLR